MRIGVYIDGYNLYYGGKRLAGSAGAPPSSWKWATPRGIAETVLKDQMKFAASHGWSQMLQAWDQASVDRVVYCTARVAGVQNPSAQVDQDIYLKALVATSAVDHIEYGKYQSRVKVAPLATRTPGSGVPQLVTSNWPVVVKDQAGNKVPDAMFFVSYVHNEEKGSDVNVASHLLIDMFRGDIEGAIVISNDSDLKYPIAEARKQIPVGVVNPSGRYTAGDLQPPHNAGQGPHWNRMLRLVDFTSNQLSDPAGAYPKPAGW